MSSSKPAHAPLAQPPSPHTPGSTPPTFGPARPRWCSHELLANGPEAEIDHDGQVYRLRRTALGKLILTK